MGGFAKDTSEAWLIRQAQQPATVAAPCGCCFHTDAEWSVSALCDAADALKVWRGQHEDRSPEARAPYLAHVRAARQTARLGVA